MARIGYTTGSCSAAAAKAATYMLLTGKFKNRISITTPKGILFDAQLVDIDRSENRVSCAVIKDGGDDPDVTTGAYIYATVEYMGDSPDMDESVLTDGRVYIDGGAGVGRVTKPGLDQPVGNAAINSVPRAMIAKEVLEVMKVCDYRGALSVIISVPDGEAIASKTFNPRLGIVGGISILGTTGIVEPMSSQAIIDTIQVEMNQKKALGYEYVPVSPGNYGLEYMKRTYDFDLDTSVKCSNFIGEMIDIAVKCEFAGMLLTGHIGKLVKVAGGMMNTHSQYGDNRMQVLAEAAARCGATKEVPGRIYECVVTEDAVDILDSAGIRHKVMDDVMDNIMKNLRKRLDTNGMNSNMQIECMMYSNKHGVLAVSSNAEKILARIMKQ